MGLLSTKSSSTTQNVSNVNERQNVFTDNSEGDGSKIFLSDSRADISILDGGVIDDAFKFAGNAIETNERAFLESLGFARGVSGQAIQAAENASRGEISAALNTAMRYGLIAFAIYFGVKAVT